MSPIVNATEETLETESPVYVSLCVPSESYRAPGWESANHDERAVLFEKYLGPPSGQYEESWAIVHLRLRQSRFDFAAAGLPGEIH